MSSFETITDYLKTFSQSIKEVENMSLKKRTLLGGWILTTAKVFKVWERRICLVDLKINYTKNVK